MAQAILPVADGRRARWVEHRTGRRAEFVAAGAAAVDRFGPDVSAEQVAELALVSRTVLYRYFRDRDDLRLAVADFIVDDLVATIELHVRVREPRTVRAAIESPIAAVAEWFDRYPNRHFFIRTQRNSLQPSRIASTFASRVADTLRKSMASIGIQDAQSVPLAHGIVGLVEYMAAWWLDERAVSREQLTSIASAAIWSLIDSQLRSLGVEMSYDDLIPVPERERLSLA